MKIECIKIINIETGQDHGKSSWLTVGNVYQVLSIFTAVDGLIEYRLIGDDNYTPALFRADQFRILDGNLPPNWVANYELGSYFELAPKSWTKSAFWEGYFDGEPEAMNCFITEKNIITQSNEQY